MGVETLLSVEEYLNTSYSPDMEYRDGVLVERNVGANSHAGLQAALTIYLGRWQRQWRIKIYTELRIRVREKWYPIPDVCVYPWPAPKERYPSRPPLLWIEILSPDDRMADVWAKAKELVASGIPYVWVIEPDTLDSELWTVNGMEPVAEKTLRIPGTPIVIPLAEVVQEAEDQSTGA